MIDFLIFAIFIIGFTLLIRLVNICSCDGNFHED